jgi:hypothetical protein
MWCRLEPQQAPEVLRAPLQTLSLTTQSVLDTLTIRQGTCVWQTTALWECAALPAAFLFIQYRALVASMDSSKQERLPGYFGKQ